MSCFEFLAAASAFEHQNVIVMGGTNELMMSERTKTKRSSNNYIDH